jgi:hypothetical protein
MPQKPESIILYASQVAACIGYNKHKTPAEAMESMWERMYPDSYRQAMQRTGLITEAQKLESMVSANPLIAKIIGDSTTPCDSSAHVSVTYDATSKLIQGLHVDADSREIIDSTVKRNLYTTYGTLSEHHALAKIREDVLIDAKPDDVFYKKQVATVDGIVIYVGGKIDGITEDRSLVVEIKNRIRRLFYKVPFYEIIQLQCYLHLLNVRKGVIVECLNASDLSTTMNVVPISRDTHLWENVLIPKMKDFVVQFVSLTTDTTLQDAFLKAPAHKKQTVLRRFMTTI